MSVGSVLKSIRRRLFGAPAKPRARTNPDQWWDQRYERLEPYTVAGHMELTEQQNEEEHELRWEMLRDALQRHRQPGQDRLLDAGCGNGLLSSRFAQLDLDVKGIDFSPAAIAKAREAKGGSASFERAGIDTYAPDRPFDFIVCNSVLMMITDDVIHRRCVTNMAGMLTPGGYMVLEEFLVPRGEKTPEEPDGMLRRRRLEDYLRIVEPTDVELVEEIPFVTPHGGQLKQILVFQRQGVGKDS